MPTSAPLPSLDCLQPAPGPPRGMAGGGRGNQTPWGPLFAIPGRFHRGRRGLACV